MLKWVGGNQVSAPVTTARIDAAPARRTEITTRTLSPGTRPEPTDALGTLLQRCCRRRTTPASRSLIQRVEVKVLVPQKGKKPTEQTIETDKLPFARLAEIASMNPENTTLIEELARRASQTEVTELREVLTVVPDKFLIDESAPLAAWLEPMLREMRTWSPSKIVQLLGSTATMKLIKLKGELVDGLRKTALETQVSERTAERAHKEKEERERALTEQDRLTRFCKLMLSLVAEFLDNREAESDARIAELERERNKLSQASTLKAATQIGQRIVALAGQIYAADNTGWTLGLADPMHRSGYDEIRDFEIEHERRRRAAERVLSKRRPALTACLHQLDKQIVTCIRYRGSLTDRLKNESKSMALTPLSRPIVRIIDLHWFDIDAFIEIDDATWELWGRQKLIPALALTTGKLGLRELHVYLKFFETHEPKEPDDELRFAVGRYLRKAVGELLAQEEALQRDLAEIAGYKRASPPAANAQSSPSSSSSSSSSGSAATEPIGDFGFVLQPQRMTAEQTARGKRYPADQLRSVYLRLNDLLSVQISNPGADPMPIAAIRDEPREIPFPNVGGGRGRAYTI